MKKLQKRYYVLVFVLAIAAGAFLRSVEEKPFEIVRTATVYAPESETPVMAEEETIIININESDMFELTRLPGIGEGLAKRIVDYRTKNGNFETIQDIMKVEGIGEKIFEDIKNQICV